MNHFKTSKLLSYVLRHNPDRLGLTLDARGWADVDQLLQALNKDGKPLTFQQLKSVVDNNDKQRFALDETNNRIRANQGHSINIDLALQAQTPPAPLYHGTALRYLSSIQTQGLVKGTRQHVHLSADKQTAHKVGSRHGKPIILTVDTAQMQTDGHHFYCSENGVWLTDAVPPQYLTLLS